MVKASFRVNAGTRLHPQSVYLMLASHALLRECCWQMHSVKNAFSGVIVDHVDGVMLEQVNLLKRVNYVNLVKLLGYCQTEQQVLVYEFAEEGSIGDHLHGQNHTNLSCK
jgi:hypothetical protein